MTVASLLSKMRTVRFVLKLAGLTIGLLLILFVADFVEGNFLTDDWYREGMENSGEEKAVIYEMRNFYHGKAVYPALSLEELHNKKILDDDRYAFIKSHWLYYYRPFSSETSDHAPVLRLGPPWIGEVLHKGDFTAGQNDGDIVITN